MTKNKRQINFDIFIKVITATFSIFGIVALLLMFAFILKEAFPAYRDYGILNLYFSVDYSRGNYGMLGGLMLTLISSLLSILIALPIATRCAFFIHFRLHYGKKLFTTIINVIASVPSVLFGVFAFYSLSKLTNGIFGTKSGQTLINGIIMLTIMIMPILISMITNQLKTLPKNFVNSALALGKSKTYAIYTIVKKEIHSGVIIATITALGRAIGETMALSFLLTSIPGQSVFLNGFFGIFLNNTMTLGVVIAKTYFDDVGGSKSHLFAASILLFFVIMILVAIATKIASKKTFVSNSPINRLKRLLNDYKSEPHFTKLIVLIWFYILYPFSFFNFSIKSAWFRFKIWIKTISYYVSIPLAKLMYPSLKNKKIATYFVEVSKGKTSNFFGSFRILLETISLFIVYGFAIWLIIDIITNGVPLWTINDWKYSYYKPGQNFSTPGRIANPLVFTALLIVVVVSISFPIALFTALYLTEYASKKRRSKIIRFFLDSLGGTPSILFGIFGSIFFIHVLDLRIGNVPYSFIAGSLTMVLVVIPTFTRSIEQTLLKVPDSYRFGSLALGASKSQTIFKVILPQSLAGIFTGIILTSGRIIAETAPIYLTFGIILTSGQIGLLHPGHTITTQILIEFWTSTNFQLQREIAYKLGSAAIFLSILITLVIDIVIPFFRNNPFKKIVYLLRKKTDLKKVKAYA